MARWASLNTEYRAASVAGTFVPARRQLAGGWVRRARPLPGRAERAEHESADSRDDGERHAVAAIEVARLDAARDTESRSGDGAAACGSRRVERDRRRCAHARCHNHQPSVRDAPVDHRLGRDARPSPVPHPHRRRRDRRRRARWRPSDRASTPPSARPGRSRARTTRFRPTARFQYAVAADPAARLPAVPFHGPWQAGIVNPPPPAACFVSFNVTAAGRARADRPAEDADRARPLPDPGRRAGRPRARRPAVRQRHARAGRPCRRADLHGRVRLDPVRRPIRDRRPQAEAPDRDDLVPQRQPQPGPVRRRPVVQICAGSQDTAIHALRDIAKHTRGGMQILWRMDGFVSPARPAGVPRNHFGFMDGIANPNVTDPAVANRLLWVVPRAR